MGKIFLLVFIYLLLVFGCKTIVDPGPSQNILDTTTIMPLKLGNSWSYKVTMFDTSKNVDTTFAVFMFLASDTVINSEHWYDDSRGYIYSNRSKGLWRAINSDTNYFALYPANKNDKFQILWDTATVISTDSTIVVPAGKYSCYVYKARYSLRFFSPGIGLIYAEEYYHAAYSNDFILKWELTTYSLNIVTPPNQSIPETNSGQAMQICLRSELMYVKLSIEV